MPRLSLRNKLIIGFLIVLLPMLALIVYDYDVGYRQLSEDIMDAQLRTGEAIAALADASVDDAFSIAWSFSYDPVIRSMDHRQIDPYLESQAQFFPQLDSIAVFDLEGRSVGSMALRAATDAPRPSVDDRPYFQAVKSTGKPVVSNVLISRGTGRPILVAAVPMFDSSQSVQGVTIATLDLDYLAQRVATVGLHNSQAIYMTDPEGTLVFHTALPREEWGQLNFLDNPPVQSALRGIPARERGIMTPLGDERIVVATRTAKYGWVVGVSVPTAEALQPVHVSLIRRLLLFSGVLTFAGVIAVLLSRHVILRPLELLRRHLMVFGRGQMEHRITLRTGDEMELVAETFNQMAAKLQDWSQERERLLDDALTAHRELDEARRRREEFISMVAHDLRNPLAVMVGYAEMVAQGLQGGRELDPRLADKILCQVGRVRRLVEDISAASLIEAGRFKIVRTNCDLRKMAHDVVEQQQMMTTKHRVNLDAPPAPILGEWDGDRLAQALNNLVGNAIKYSTAGEIWVKLAATGGKVTVSVSDEGVGIAPEDLPHLCQPYSRLCGEYPVRGTGLGLYITKAIVEAHGGHLWVESEQDKGSTFSFKIPVESLDSRLPAE